MAFVRRILCSLCCCLSLQGDLLMVRRESVRGGAPGGTQRGGMSLSHAPPVSPLLHVIRGRAGDSVRLLIHEAAVLHETLKPSHTSEAYFLVCDVEC